MTWNEGLPVAMNLVEEDVACKVFGIKPRKLGGFRRTERRLRKVLGLVCDYKAKYWNGKPIPCRFTDDSGQESARNGLSSDSPTDGNKTDNDDIDDFVVDEYIGPTKFPRRNTAVESFPDSEQWNGRGENSFGSRI
jgi:hypothetical protein